MIKLYPSNTDLPNLSRWSWCYLHGMAEFNEQSSNGDIFLADCLKPDEGSHAVTINGEAAVAVINADGSGRIALVSDTLALKHALSGEWE